MAHRQTQQGDFSTAGALKHIATDASHRGSSLLASVRSIIVAQLLGSIPMTSAGYTSFNDTPPTYKTFELASSDDPAVLADIDNFVIHDNNYGPWMERGRAIRHAGSRAYCIGNLSLALDGLGSAYSFGSQGASTLLTLIPTAAVLIGAPAKELWILYKLCPLAGLLSVLLSLGVNIIPMELNDYDNIQSLHFQSLIAADEVHEKEENIEHKSEPEKFAWQVLQRSRDVEGAQPVGRIWIGIALQMLWIGVLLVICYFISQGAIVVWLCDWKGWMFFWYGTVCVASVIENFAGVPFRKTTTIRVWRVPRVSIDPDTPWVISPPVTRTGYQPRTDASPPMPTAQFNIPRRPVSAETIETVERGSPPSTRSEGHTGSPYLSQTSLITAPKDSVDILGTLEKGFNTFGNVYISPHAPWSQANDAFYVLLSIRGVSNVQACFRVFSKVLSIGVFGWGTSMFASTTLITNLPATIAAVMILGVSLFGRVTAMYMASTMMRNKPVLHKIVRSQAEADRYLDAMFRQPDLAFEVLGHVIIQGRCVKRFGRKIRLSHILGVLVKAFDLRSLAVSGPDSRRRSAPSDYYALHQREISIDH